RMGVRAPKSAVQVSVACEEDVPLVAEVGVDRAAVGKVRAKTRIEVLDRAAGWARVRVPRGMVQARDAGRWLVREKDPEKRGPAQEEPSPWGSIEPSGLGVPKK